MNRNFLYALIITTISLILLASCQREVVGELPDADPNNPGAVSPLRASVTGLIVDENGLPLAGVSIKSGSNATVTGSDGYFRFNNITLDKYNSLVTAEIDGYFKGYRIFSVSGKGANFIKVQLLKKIVAGTISGTNGGSVTIGSHIITFPSSSSVLKSTGNNYNGNITVYAQPIDPTAANIAAILPGSLLGIDSLDKRVLLESYGMIAVELEGTSGEALQLANNKSAEINFSIPVSLQSKAPASIPLWYVDEVTGIWKQEGSAVRTGTTYTGTVKHFTFWNCDLGLSNLVHLGVTLRTNKFKGGPIPFTLVSITRANLSGTTTTTFDYTDSTGYVGGLVPANEKLILKIINECGVVVYTRTINPASQNIYLGEIYPDLGLHEINISGKINNCNNKPITSGWAQVYLGNKYYFAPVDPSGIFNISVVHCGNTNISVVGNDITGKQTGTAKNYIIGVDDLQHLILSACGSPLVDYEVTTIAGDGSYGFQNGIGIATKFNGPSGIVADAAGNIFIADGGNHAIRKIDPAGIVSTLAGDGTAGYIDGNISIAKLNTPHGLTIDAAGNLIFTEQMGARIRKITPAGIVSTIAGDGTPGYADGQGTAARFNRPENIKCDAAGNLYVTDLNNFRIRKITPAGLVSTLAGDGTLGFANGQGISAKFGYLYGLAVDAAGNVFVGDDFNNMIRKITPAGVVSTYAGALQSGHTDGPLTLARFDNPFDILFDNDQNMIVIDFCMIRKIDKNGIVKTIAGSLPIGYKDGIGIIAKFDFPTGIAINKTGDLFVTERNNLRIRKLRQF